MEQPGSISLSHIQSDSTLPLVVIPAQKGLDLMNWALANKEFIENSLVKYGAILFRDFNPHGVEKFEQFISTLYGSIMPYQDRATPRSQVHGSIYTATDYPPEQSIFLHNESSFAYTWPRKIFFHCLIPPASGGETPLADVRKVFNRISPTIREKFMRKKVLYVRNFGGPFGLRWQDVFQTDDKDQMEAYCREARIDTEWRSEQHLRTRQVRPAVASHPQTGEMVWFNHATVLHVSTISPEQRTMLLKMCSEENLPNNTYYGDGSPIEPDVLESLRAAYLTETIIFSWQQSDTLLVDNLLVAHGRNPYTGKRQVVVGMVQPSSWSEM